MDMVLQESNDVISCLRVYDLGDSILASGLPMMSKVPENWEEIVGDIENCIKNHDYSNKHIRRAITLSNAEGGGHNQFLTGILVSFNLTLTNKAWVEAERYRFLSFVSSQSTMHRITKFDINSSCNDMVDPQAIAIVKKYVEIYNGTPTLDNYLNILYNIPSGMKITARMTTNYRCLKNIYHQRKDHRLPEWHKFCDIIEKLPLADVLIV